MKKSASGARRGLGLRGVPESAAWQDRCDFSSRLLFSTAEKPRADAEKTLRRRLATATDGPPAGRDRGASPPGTAARGGINFVEEVKQVGRPRKAVLLRILFAGLISHAEPCSKTRRALHGPYFCPLTETPLRGWRRTASQANSWSNRLSFSSWSPSLACLRMAGTGNPTGLRRYITAKLQ